MREITVLQALNEAVREEMARDGRVFLIGEDIAGLPGGPFGVYRGIPEEFGLDRVLQTPISETAIVGAALGAALTGMRPIAEIMYMDFICIAMDQIVNRAAKVKYMTGGQATVPLVVRTPAGANLGDAAQHSQCLEAWFVHIPGLKVVMPSTPYDAKGLLKSAIRDDNPVVFIEHRVGYSRKGFVPDEEYTVPLGKADIKREGKDVTIIATSVMVYLALEAAEELAKEGISAEVIDPRTLRPLDTETLVASVKKTGKLIVVHEACKTGGIGGEIITRIMEEAFQHLDAPPRRVANIDLPIPYNHALAKAVLPTTARIVREAKELCSY